MENMGVTPTLSSLSGAKIFLTGHTGFKGSWMTALLSALGCKVHGYALAPGGLPNLYQIARVHDLLVSETIADIRDGDALRRAVSSAAPDIVIHMAAQSLVRRGYQEPVETWGVNVLGTVQVLEAARACPSVAGVVVVTTDKCYENVGWEWGYRENDRLGGHDPYSASKAGAELVAESYRRSFFSACGQIASVRAGNVVGGGDWSEDRLVADAARAASTGAVLKVRNPKATRPWQHVMDCLGGYLLVAKSMLARDDTLHPAYNFGPDISGNVPVSDLLTRLQAHWPELKWEGEAGAGGPHEASVLYLDSSRARQHLRWSPAWNLDETLARTASWYRAFNVAPERGLALMMAQIEEFLD